MVRVQLSRLNEVRFDTKSSAWVFLQGFCNIWVLCEDTGATSCREKLWRLHEFRFYRNLSTGLFFFMFSARFAFSLNIQVSQCLENSCEGFKNSSFDTKEDNRTVSLCFSSCFFCSLWSDRCELYQVHWWLFREYTLCTNRRTWFFLYVLCSLGKYRCMGRIQSWSLHEYRFSTKRRTWMFLYDFCKFCFLWEGTGARRVEYSCQRCTSTY
jgi:hypothetical protein